jgi:oligopeptide/dipeptide ABC transporter ATP-binding protein
MAMILVTHDLGVVAETCARAIVMYCGVIVEAAPTARLFSAPHHPYTVGLLQSVPRIRERRLEVLPVIPGRVPDLAQLPAGCRFADRCPRVLEQCRVSEPLPEMTADGSLVACFNPHT